MVSERGGMRDERKERRVGKGVRDDKWTREG